MNFNKLAKESHANSVKHGFWEKRESNEHCLMLVVSEIGEMVEAHRAGERTTVETKDFESLRIDQSQIVAIVDKSDQQVTYDGETWCSYEKVYNT